MLLSVDGFSKGLLFLVIIVVLIIRHNLLLVKTMNNITESNRYMSGNYVWLNLIPIFNIFWILIFNSALNKSIEAEIKHKKINYRFLGITGILFPLVTYGTFLSYLILEISGVVNDSESISELTLITFIFSLMAIVWGWLYYTAEIASFNKMNTVAEETNYVRIALYTIVIISVLLTLFLSYNYWENYTAQQQYERSLN
jgi:hypothetical protein